MVKQIVYTPDQLKMAVLNDLRQKNLIDWNDYHV